MGNDHGPSAQSEHELLEHLEPGEVKVIGGFVQQRNVKARQGERSQAGPRQFAPGQGCHGRPEQVGAGSQRGQPCLLYTSRCV